MRLLLLANDGTVLDSSDTITRGYVAEHAAETMCEAHRKGGV